MAKQRRPTRGSDVPQRDVEAVGPDRAEPALSANEVAHDRALAAHGPADTVRGGLAAEDGGASRLATALRMAPRDRAATERLTVVVERSTLPSERKDAILVRLRADQQLADDVVRHVSAAIGADSEGARSSLADVLGAAGAGHAARALVERLPDWFGGDDGASRAEALCEALASTAPWWWDEEENEPQPGDYAMEESGS